MNGAVRKCRKIDEENKSERKYETDLSLDEYRKKVLPDNVSRRTNNASSFLQDSFDETLDAISMAGSKGDKKEEYKQKAKERGWETHGKKSK